MFSVAESLGEVVWRRGEEEEEEEEEGQREEG